MLLSWCHYHRSLSFSLLAGRLLIRSPVYDALRTRRTPHDIRGRVVLPEFLPWRQMAKKMVLHTSVRTSGSLLCSILGQETGSADALFQARFLSGNRSPLPSFDV
ncbi:hypothetical protein CSUI_004940 [Cystoisospora suis]|uniref:Uncharacterized protein n=1 Tax=Cystoisospora suis TaxID=483139 RepID=A0A2C6KZA3_9APIC|nr:hypothetical protein CSUI_004940 [Cystoisospora suis]